MIINDEFDVLQSNKEQCAELCQVLPAETLSGSDASKEKVAERVTSRSSSLVQFSVRGAPGGRADDSRCKRGGERGFVILPYSLIVTV